ncbi:phosphoadenosine phosphosulfate reductase family protein [Helicobacter typhlonius]|uniref:phosphoadenosine phosphosulfate reductase domain-containing protein n=1 Tax=Helicobacter typhlonius TaxID=76936 RepID=UPI002FE0A5B5
MISANLSGGRDSSAMVVKWLELGNELDYIIFCDTGYEFKEMYEYIDKLDSYLQRNFNKPITRIDSTKEIYKWAFEYPIQSGENKGKLRGIPKIIGKEYCTRETKVYPTKRFVLDKSPNKFKNTALIGYTYNEVENGRVSNLDYAVSKYPLHKWRMNEQEVDIFLKERGIHNKLYEKFSRTGCYFCPKQSLYSLYNLWRYYSKEFETMIEWEKKAKELNCVNQTWKIGKDLQTLAKEFSKKTPELFLSDTFTQMETCFCGK